MFRKQYRSTRPLAHSFAAMATTKETMTNEADKLLTPAQKALNNLIQFIGLALPTPERMRMEIDYKTIISELSRSELCHHEIRERVSTVGGMLECVYCGSRWIKRINTETWLPFDPTICECCGQKKPTV